MRLYEFGPTRSIRVRWTLQELGVPFESIIVNMMKGEHRSPEFLAVNPAGKLPAPVDGDLVLYERPSAPPRIAVAFASLGIDPAPRT